MAKKKIYTIEGLEDCEITVYKNMCSADFNLDVPFMTTQKMTSVISKLNELGFQYNYCSHQLGYYDAVINQTLEFSHQNAKSLPLIIKE